MPYPQGPDETQAAYGWPRGYQEYPPTPASGSTGAPFPMPASGGAGASFPTQASGGAPSPAQPPYWQPMSAAPIATQPAARRTWWRYPAGATVLLVLLLASFLMGHALVGTGTSPSSSTTGSSATVTTAAQDLQQTVVNVIHNVQPSVVEVTSRAINKEGIGSGVILTADGYIVTNDHVVRGYSSYTVTLSNGQAMPARLVGESPENDLAVLKVQASNLQPITFADSSKVEVGQFAIAIGNPLGLENSATFGIISALNRTASEQPDGPAGTLTGLIQTSAALNPGNSGGALVDLQGRLIGIPTLGAAENQTGTPANDIGLVIPSNQVKAVAEQIIQQGG